MEGFFSGLTFFRSHAVISRKPHKKALHEGFLQWIDIFLSSCSLDKIFTKIAHSQTCLFHSKKCVYCEKQKHINTVLPNLFVAFNSINWLEYFRSNLTIITCPLQQVQIHILLFLIFLALTLVNDRTTYFLVRPNRTITVTKMTEPYRRTITNQRLIKSVQKQVHYFNFNIFQ